MKKIIQFLFSIPASGNIYSFVLLLFRLLFGGLFMSHGIQKWIHFSELSASFPDPLGVGSSISLLLAIFGEVACSIAFVFGFLHRLVLIPMIFTMCIAFFVIHGGDVFANRELAFLYMMTFVILYISGSGKYSIDYWLGKKLPGLLSNK